MQELITSKGAHINLVELKPGEFTLLISLPGGVTSGKPSRSEVTMNKEELTELFEIVSEVLD